MRKLVAVRRVLHDAGRVLGAVDGSAHDLAAVGALDARPRRR